jgi:hypothetical protein
LYNGTVGTNAGIGGNYGGGGGGHSRTANAGSAISGAGASGLVVVAYTPAAASGGIIPMMGL